MRILNELYKWIRAGVITVEMIRGYYYPSRKAGLSKLDAFSNACKLTKEAGKDANYFRIELER